MSLRRTLFRRCVLGTHWEADKVTRRKLYVLGNMEDGLWVKNSFWEKGEMHAFLIIFNRNNFTRNSFSPKIGILRGPQRFARMRENRKKIAWMRELKRLAWWKSIFYCVNAWICPAFCVNAWIFPFHPNLCKFPRFLTIFPIFFRKFPRFPEKSGLREFREKIAWRREFRKIFDPWDF